MPSPREQAADNLVETCAFGGLNDSYGIQKVKMTNPKGKTYWHVTFCKARYLDGSIDIYSERFILVKWRTAYRTMAAEGQELFKNEDAARDFIAKSFINL